jgi:hypothetical protein
MCTVSAAFAADGAALRIVANRDERRLRMQARPPERFAPYGVPAIWPVDQEAGGTWAAVTATGLAFVLLNVSAPGWKRTGRDHELVTRGAVIPYLAASADIEDVERRFVSGPARWPCRPFKLLVASIDRLVLLTPLGSIDLEAPLVLSTSSLGDDLVEGPRRTLFADLLASSATAWQAQDRLHQHAWPDRRHVSALMRRADACTVSRTEMVLGREGVEMRYAVLCDGWPAGIAAAPKRLARLRTAAAA